MFKIYDGRAFFYQWDLNRKLIVEDSSIKEVHFCNRSEDCSLVCEVYTINGTNLVNVPNILLQKCFAINVYAYDGESTKHSALYRVLPKSKPADYVYTETEVKTWEELSNKIDNFVLNADNIPNGSITIDKVNQSFFREGIVGLEGEDITLHLIQKMPSKQIYLSAELTSKTSEITEESTEEIPTAKAVYEYVQSVLPPLAEEVKY